MAKQTDNFAPLHIGQRIRVTINRLIPGQPALAAESWFKETTEGTITGFRRTDGGVMVGVSPPGCDPEWVHVIITPHGPFLRAHGKTIEILAEAPNQGRLFGTRAAG